MVTKISQDKINEFSKLLWTVAIIYLTLGLEWDTFPSSAELESVSMLFWKATCNQSNMTNIKEEDSENFTQIILSCI